MTISILAEALRAAAAIVEHAPEVDYVSVGVVDGVASISLACATDQQLQSLALSLGEVSDVVLRRAEAKGKFWIAAEGGRFRGFEVRMYGPHRSLTEKVAADRMSA